VALAGDAGVDVVLVVLSLASRLTDSLTQALSGLTRVLGPLCLSTRTLVVWTHADLLQADGVSVPQVRVCVAALCFSATCSFLLLNSGHVGELIYTYSYSPRDVRDVRPPPTRERRSDWLRLAISSIEGRRKRQNSGWMCNAPV